MVAVDDLYVLQFEGRIHSWVLLGTDVGHVAPVVDASTMMSKEMQGWQLLDLP